MDNIEILLARIKEITNYAIGTERDFNIFKILAVEHRETAFCRFIGALLDPMGLHGADSLPLKLFFKYALGISDTVLRSSRIELEEYTQNGRRVDIAIHNGESVYPIEVKIWADDRQLQISDYYGNYFKNKEGTIYYLTPDGHKPSEASTGTLDTALIRCISFDELGCWLDALCADKSFGQKDICRQFRLFVNDIKERYKMSDKVIKKIFEYEDTRNIAAAVAVIEEKENILKRIKEDFLYKLKKLIEDTEYNENNKSNKYLCAYEGYSDEDKFRCLRISKEEYGKEKNLYHICIDHRLYITTDGYSEKNTGWKKDPAWTYIVVDGQDFNFKHPGYNVIEFAYGKDAAMAEKMKRALDALLNDDPDEEK